MPHVHLEPISFVVRIFADGKEYGDPYEWCATAVRIAPGTIEIMGALRAPTLAEYRALQRDLQALGFEHIVYNRKKSGKDYKLHEAPTNPKKWGYPEPHDFYK